MTVMVSVLRYSRQMQRSILPMHQLVDMLTVTQYHVPKSHSRSIANKPQKHNLNMETSGEQLIAHLGDDLVVIDEFISQTEEDSIISEINPYMERLRYEYDHWDDAIHGFRETERQNWNDLNTTIMKRVGETAFNTGVKPMSLVHILDLEKNGFIKPHVDSVRFCGDTIAGISLLSDSVMKLVCTTNKESWVKLLLKKHSLYIMRNKARYNYTHELLSNEESEFKGSPILKDRRVSIICRNEPSDDTST